MSNHSHTHTHRLFCELKKHFLHDLQQQEERKKIKRIESLVSSHLIHAHEYSHTRDKKHSIQKYVVFEKVAHTRTLIRQMNELTLHAEKKFTYKLANK